MFSESAQHYDAIYGAFKDYAAESARVAALVREIDEREGLSGLDVACGTGEHARHLRVSHGLAVDGLDLDPGLLAVARQKLPTAQFFEADMSDFALGRRYDVVMCLFSSIGYLKTLDRVAAALRCFRAHLKGGGAVIVEPWFEPGVLQAGRLSVKHGESDGVRIERTSRVAVEGRLSTLTFDYLIEDAAGVRAAREVHTLGLLTSAEMLSCFREAGLEAAYDPVGLSGRGLYLARASTGAKGGGR